MHVNGLEHTLSSPVVLSDFLVGLGYDLARIAVERNGQIVPRPLFDTVLLADEDRLEVVSFVGGG